jgi:hypothetical protein
LSACFWLGPDQRITSGPAATAAASQWRSLLHAKTGRIHGCTRTLRRKPDSSCTAGAVHTWPLATDRIFTADGRFGCEADVAGPATRSTRSLVTQLYGPAVRSKKNFDELAASGLASMYQTSDWSLAPGRHGYQRAGELIRRKASIGLFGSPVFACAGKTEPPSCLNPLADLGR